VTREGGSPTVRRRELGALLRTLRADRGLSAEEVTERLLFSPTKLSRIETGHSGASQRDIRDLCELYGVTDPDERARLMNLAQEGKQRGWWQDFDLPYATFVGLEAEAAAISVYQSGDGEHLLHPGVPDAAGVRHRLCRGTGRQYLPRTTRGIGEISSSIFPSPHNSTRPGRFQRPDCQDLCKLHLMSAS
jgi:transcriptional regulator with XRE-family HTH domain